MPPKSRAAGPRAHAVAMRRRTSCTATHIKSTFNNTIVSITDPNGNVISWASSGSRRLRVRVRAPVRRAARRRERRPQGAGARRQEGRRVRQGTGFGRETAIRSLRAAGLEVGTISDVTRSRTTAAAPKRRRV